MEIVNIEAQARESFGKKHTKKVRKEGMVPAIIYGGSNNTAISVTPKSVKSLVYTPDFKLAEINVNGETNKCILKDITFHPISDEIVHIDFLRVIPGTPIRVEIPVGFKGVSPGVKEGGKLIPQMRKVKVKTMPESLVDKVFVDISSMDLGGSVRVRDIDFPEGMEIMTTGATPVAIVEVPRALKSAAAAEAKEGQGEAAAE
ncbi:MAG: 50S ribosomal protein L25 [Saprospiraceae bacterium]|nr:50S ribosomal protein L25 [Saprospiraceae bacterium]